MSGRPQKKTVIVTSVVLGVVSMILMTIMKRSVFKIPLIRKFLRIKNIGLDSMKDFLEIAELNYRVATPSDKLGEVVDELLDSSDEGFDDYKDLRGIGPDSQENGTSVVWDSDDSQLYTIFVSTEPIPKQLLFGEERIPLLTKKEIGTLSKASNWIRRIVVGYAPPPAPKSPGSPRNPSDKEDRKKEKQKGTRDTEDADPLHSGQTRTQWKIPFVKFYSRLKSSNGRVSKEISHPIIKKSVAELREVDTRLVKAGRDYFLDIKENDLGLGGHIYDYQVVLYVADGHGLKVRVPSFTTETTVTLGHLPPCLCYLTGVREIGASFEQFVGWIEEERALTLDGELEQYLDGDSHF